MENFDSLFEAANNSATSAQGSFPKIDCEGTWTCKVIEATFAKNQKGDANRTMVKLEVIANQGESQDRVTARTNAYITVAGKKELTERNFAPWIGTLIDAGITPEKIKYEATDMYDIAQNIATILTKQIKLAKEILVTLQTKANPSGGFYKNIYKYVAPVAAVVASEPVAETKPATTTKAPKAKVVEAPIAPDAESEDAWLD